MFKKIFIALISIISLWIGGFCTYVYDLMHLDYPCNGIADGIVVLTGGRGRIERGLNLLHNNKAPRLLISGVHKDYKIKRLINDQLLPLMDHVELGYAAFTTTENTYEAFFWAHKYNMQSLYMVTADYHIRRAQIEFQITLPNLQIYPCPVLITRISNMNMGVFMRLNYEFNKLLATWLRLQINQLHQWRG